MRSSSPRLVESAVTGFITQHFGDAKKLVVFRIAITSTRGARLDLSRIGGHSQIGDRRIFGFARAMGDDGIPTGTLGGTYRLQRLGECSNLIHLDQNRIGGFKIDGLVQEVHLRLLVAQVGSITLLGAEEALTEASRPRDLHDNVVEEAERRLLQILLRHLGLGDELPQRVLSQRDQLFLGRHRKGDGAADGAAEGLGKLGWERGWKGSTSLGDPLRRRLN